MNSKILFISIFSILLLSSAFAEELGESENVEYEKPNPSDLVIGLVLIVIGLILGLLLFNLFGVLIGFGLIATGLYHVVKYFGVLITPWIVHIWSIIWVF